MIGKYSIQYNISVLFLIEIANSFYTPSHKKNASNYIVSTVLNLNTTDWRAYNLQIGEVRGEQKYATYTEFELTTFLILALSIGFFVLPFILHFIFLYLYYSI